MKLGIISDLHSNVHALDAVLPALADHHIQHLIVLGDLFGYYPWARQTWQRLCSAPWPMTLIKGNHDEMLLRQHADPSSVTPPAYAASINQNLQDLAGTDALSTLRALTFSWQITLSGANLHLVHGTPADPENGRHYPSDSTAPSWQPALGHWLLLGHTHHALIRTCDSGGTLINPGSVGQPRDGDPRAAFAVLDLPTSRASLHRVAYDIPAAQAALHDLGWCERSIRALDKRHTGTLDPSPSLP